MNARLDRKNLGNLFYSSTVDIFFVTRSNFETKAPSNHSFYDKFTLIATYIIKKDKKTGT